MIKEGSEPVVLPAAGTRSIPCAPKRHHVRVEFEMGLDNASWMIYPHLIVYNGDLFAYDRV